jgi:hypothetical protein
MAGAADIGEQDEESAFPVAAAAAARFMAAGMVAAAAVEAHYGTGDGGSRGDGSGGSSRSVASADGSGGGSDVDGGGDGGGGDGKLLGGFIPPRWYAKFEALQRFVAEHGHARVPSLTDTPDYPKLGCVAEVSG